MVGNHRSRQTVGTDSRVADLLRARSRNQSTPAREVEISFETIEYEVRDGIATISLNRPDQLNAVNTRMELDLMAAFDLVDSDDEVRAVVVTGNGRAFCAGFDLSGGGFDVLDYAEARGDEIPAGEVPRDGGGVIALRVYRCTKPVIGAINGVGVGFGATFPLPMDVRIAAEGVRFGFVFSRRGMCLDAASAWFLPRAVGISRALDWAISGRLVPAREALEAGLLRSIHAPEQLLDAARTIAAEMVAGTAPVSVAINRQLLWQMSAAPHPMDAHRMESVYIASRAATADAEEGARSFLEKRDPEFPLTVGSDLPEGFPPRPEPSFYPSGADTRP